MQVERITEHSIITPQGEEIVLFLLQPTNVSVLSRESLRARVNALMHVLKGFVEVELLCLNSRESFEHNKRYLTGRMEQEESVPIRTLLEQDLRHLDEIQSRTATAREFMLYMAAVKGLDKKLAKKRTENLLHMVNLSDVADKKIKSYSGGMKQRLGIAQAELNSPAILILDEPTAGLDPKERVRFRNLISDFAKEKIVILSTHIVSDVSYIADTILMMKEGHFLLQEPMSTVTDSIRGKVWELLVDERTAAEYSRKFSVVNLHHENNMVRLRMIEETAPGEDAQAVEPSLEDLFLYHFGEEAEQQEER